MLVKDNFYTACTAFVAHDRPWLAGLADVAGDLANVLSIGSASLVLVQHGVAAVTLAAFAALAAGSLIGTRTGIGLSRLIERRLAVPVPHRMRQQ